MYNVRVTGENNNDDIEKSPHLGEQWVEAGQQVALKKRRALGDRIVPKGNFPIDRKTEFSSP